MNRNIPTVNQLAKYDVNRRGEFEAIREPLFDYQVYAAVGQTSLNFFQNPIGQAGKTIEDTNMELAGALPMPKQFLVENIEVHFHPAAVPVTAQNTATTDFVESQFSNDVYTALKLGTLDFFIGSKSYVKQSPLMRFPPSVRLQCDFGFMGQAKQAVAADEITSVMGDYATGTGKPFVLFPRIRLISQQNFNVTLSWATAQALPSTAAARIGVVMNGLLYRESQ